ncbi:tetratricopeptide repeat protein, partial [Thermodesulfobacteriota bacterium]
IQNSKNYFLRAVHITPDKPDSLMNLANIHIVLKEYDEAIGILMKCLELGINPVSSRKNLGIAYMGIGDYENAVSSFEKIPVEIRKRYPRIKKILQKAREEKSVSSKNSSGIEAK